MSKGFSATAYWTQGPEGGSFDESSWQRVMEPTTKLDSEWGPIGVSEEAHIEALPLWKKGVFAHIDHDKKDPNNEFPLSIEDAKYVPGDGLYIKVKGNHSALKLLKEGKAKPSIEIDVPDKEKDYDGMNRRAKRYVPTGLGIMIKGEANGVNVGAFEPNLHEAIGGKPNTEGNDMAEEEEFVFSKDKVDAFLTDIETTMKSEPEKLEGKFSEYKKKLDGLYGDAEVDVETVGKFVDYFKKKEETVQEEPDAKYIELMKKYKTVDLEKKKKEEIISEYKNRGAEIESLLIQKILEEAKATGVHVELIDIEGKSYNEVIKEIDLEKKRAEVYGVNLPSGTNPRPGSKPPMSGLIDQDTGYVNEEAYKKAVEDSGLFTADKEKEF